MNADPPIPDDLWQQIPPAAQAAIRALIQRCERRQADLEARLKQNSTNSSKPPSSDPPSLKRAPPKPTSTNKAGGQRGHAKAQRALVDHLDATRLTEAPFIVSFHYRPLSRSSVGSGCQR
jgi:transposase